MSYVRWVVKTPPSAEPVSLAEARLHLRDPADEQSSLIASLIATARQHIELVCQRALITQTWRASLDAFPACAIELPGGKVTEITSVAYTDVNGAAQVIVPATLQQDLDSEPARLLPAAGGGTWPATQADKANAVQVEYKVGYADSSKVPAPIKAALLLIVGDLFEQREGSVLDGQIVENPAVKRLLTPYKRVVP